MRVPWAVALLIVAWAGAALAEDELTLDEICGQTLSVNTAVRVQGGSLSFGDCAVVLDDARLRFLEANLAGDRLSVTGLGEANLQFIGTKLRADLAIDGSYKHVRLANSLFFAQSTGVDIASGEIKIRFSTFRPGAVTVATGAGPILVKSTKFRRHATFMTGSGGAELRVSDFRRGASVTTAGPGDLAFLSNVGQGTSEFAGAGKVVVAANTFELGASGDGEVLAEGADLAFLNNLVAGPATLQGDPSLVLIGNTFEAGRPTVDGNPTTCIVINNDPGAGCP